MDFCHIAPTSMLDIFCNNQRTHLVLAHLVESDDTYAKWYRDRPGSFKIMDNSAFEMYKQGRPMYPTAQLLVQAERCAADVVVMSDYPAEPWEITRDAAIMMGPVLQEAGYMTMYVPQSEIGDIHGLIQSYRWAAQQDFIDYIGVSILAVPNAYGVEKDNRLQRFLARWAFMTTLNEIGILDSICDKRIHFLGLVDGPNEIALVSQIPNLRIDSWDSSSAIWHGLNGIGYDTSPTGLLNGKLETEVDFNMEIAEDSRMKQAHLNKLRLRLDRGQII